MRHLLLLFTCWASALRAPLPPPAAVAAFAASLGGALVTSSSPLYTNASAEWNARVSSAPYAIVFVASEADVALSLGFAEAWALPLALRSGRHQVEGWSVCTACLVIDVSSLAAVRVDTAARRVTVGAGVTLGALLTETGPLGWPTPSGSCSSVGVAGYTLGGGIGWTSRLYGLAVDNLLGARIVLANGSIIDLAVPGAGDDDLAWSLTGGGGGNFGVVTQLTLALHPMPPQLLYAEFAYPWSAAVDASAAYLEAARKDPRFLFYCLYVRPSSDPEPSVLLQGIWLGDLGEGRAALQPLVELAVASNASGGASAMVVATDYLTAHQRFEGPLGSRTANKQKSALVARADPPSALPPCVSAPALALLRAALLSAPADVADNSAVYLNALGGAIALPQPNATAFVHREALLNWVVDAHWRRNESTPAGLAWARAVYGALADAGYLGEANAVYVNYSDNDLDEGIWPAAYYGDEGYARLQRTKAAVDAGGRFSFPQSVRLPGISHLRDS